MKLYQFRFLTRLTRLVQIYLFYYPIVMSLKKIKVKLTMD